jgi:hypothetical protein
VSWAGTERSLAVATNEHLERMLVELDGATGLAGDDRAEKKSAIKTISNLCSRLDACRPK